MNRIFLVLFHLLGIPLFGSIVVGAVVAGGGFNQVHQQLVGNQFIAYLSFLVVGEILYTIYRVVS